MIINKTMKYYFFIEIGIVERYFFFSISCWRTYSHSLQIECTLYISSHKHNKIFSLFLLSLLLLLDLNILNCLFLFLVFFLMLMLFLFLTCLSMQYNFLLMYIEIYKRVHLIFDFLDSFFLMPSLRRRYENRQKYQKVI